MLRHHHNPQDSATEWARGLIKRDPASWVILDTETTGLSSRDEICQIAIIDGLGNVLIDRLVKPTVDIPFEAQAIHGISNTMVQSAQFFQDLMPEILSILKGKLAVRPYQPVMLGHFWIGIESLDK